MTIEWLTLYSFF